MGEGRLRGRSAGGAPPAGEGTAPRGSRCPARALATLGPAAALTLALALALALAAWAGNPLPAAARAPSPSIAATATAARSFSVLAPVPPNDPLFGSQWNLRAIGIPDAWKVTDGTGAVVAVLDTGVAYEDFGSHRRAPDLAGTRFVPGYDFLDNDDHPDDEVEPGRPSHGTHIAGTIAETTGNGLGTAGVAPGAAIMPIRVLAPDGSGTGADIAKGLRFAADHGANIANLSLGGSAGSDELADAVNYAISKGVTVVVSSGDDGFSQLRFPAAYPGVIAVGAVRYDNTRAQYSNFGPRLDLVAPGGDTEVDQNGDGLDDGIVQQAVNGDLASFCFCFKEGTSSAAAHVSGVAALVFASGRARQPAEIARLLTSTALDLGPPGHDDEYGAGLVLATRALGLPGPATTPTSAPASGVTEPPDAGGRIGAIKNGPVVPPQQVRRPRPPPGWHPWAAVGGLAVGMAALLALVARRASLHHHRG
jgi:serine protease